MKLNYLIPFFLPLFTLVNKIIATGTILPGSLGPYVTVDIDDGDYLALIHGNTQNIGGNINVAGSFFIGDSDSSDSSFQSQFTGSTLENSGVIVVDGSNISGSSNINWNGGKIDNKGKMFLEGAAVQINKWNLQPSSSFSNTGLLSFGQGQSSYYASFAILGGPSFVNDGTICVTNIGLGQNTTIDGSGCINVGENAMLTQVGANNVYYTLGSQTVYLSTSTSMLLSSSSPYSSTIKVAGFGNGNYISYTTTINSYNYDPSSGILNIRVGTKTDYYHIGKGYDQQYFKMSSGSALIYNAPIPNESTQSNCKACEVAPWIPPPSSSSSTSISSPAITSISSKSQSQTAASSSEVSIFSNSRTDSSSSSQSDTSSKVEIDSSLSPKSSTSSKSRTASSSNFRSKTSSKAETDLSSDVKPSTSSKSRIASSSNSQSNTSSKSETDSFSLSQSSTSSNSTTAFSSSFQYYTSSNASTSSRFQTYSSSKNLGMSPSKSLTHSTLKSHVASSKYITAVPSSYASNLKYSDSLVPTNILANKNSSNWLGSASLSISKTSYASRKSHLTASFGTASLKASSTFTSVYNKTSPSSSIDAYFHYTTTITSNGAIVTEYITYCPETTSNNKNLTIDTTFITSKSSAKYSTSSINTLRTKWNTNSSKIDTIIDCHSRGGWKNISSQRELIFNSALTGVHTVNQNNNDNTSKEAYNNSQVETRSATTKTKNSINHTRNSDSTAILDANHINEDSGTIASKHNPCDVMTVQVPQMVSTNTNILTDSSQAQPFNFNSDFPNIAVESTNAASSTFINISTIVVIISICFCLH